MSQKPSYLPDPWINPDIAVPARPAVWTSEVPGYYYLSEDTGSDTNTWGRPGAPRRSMPSNPGPGTRIEFAPGENYGVGSGGNLNFTGTGNGGEWVANTSGPVWYVGDRTNMPHMDTLDGFLRGSYIYVDGLYWDTVTLAIGLESDGFPADHVLLRKCFFQGTGAEVVPRTAVGVTGFSASSKVEHLLIYQNTMQDWGDIASGFDLDCNGLIVSTHCFDVWVGENTIQRCSGSGVRFGGFQPLSHSPKNSSRFWSWKNPINNVRQGGLAIKYADLVVMAEEDSITDILDGPGGPGCGIIKQYSGQRVWIIQPVLSNANYGVQVASIDTDVPPESGVGPNEPNPCKTRIVRPAIYDIFFSPNATFPVFSESPFCNGHAIHDVGPDDLTVIGATVHRCSSGITSHTATNLIQNCIVNDITELTDGRMMFFVNDLSPDVTNCIFNPAAKIEYNGSERTLAQFQTLASTGTDCVNADPDFANPNSDPPILTLLEGSPAIGEASSYAAIEADYLTDVGVALNLAIPDIGAFEFDDGTLNITTLNATTLTVG